ncbi:response regulator [Aromatoleum sp.]|uniref:response regulator n=1 Tax=Aromatoleum sp. TaxID=2307007 RepID=UPI002FC5E25D
MSSVSASPIGILIVDDHRAILSGVAALVGSESPRMHIVGQARCRTDALVLARTARPNVIVLDVELGGDDGLDLIPPFHTCCDAAIVVFTCATDPRVRLRALRLGAAGFVSKTAPGGELIAAIDAAAVRPAPREA